MQKKVSLIILDGWGHSEKKKGNAICNAQTPAFDFLTQHCDISLLRTDGENVGLPSGIMGNSEVGHTTIGAGRVCEQSLQKINRIFLNEQNNCVDLKELHNYISKIKSCNGKMHIAGLFSAGGVHSNVKHIIKIAEICNQKNLPVLLHIFTDGRDTHPKNILHALQENPLPQNTKIATMVGRYFAMDRDQNWSRIKMAYDLIIHGQGKNHSNLDDAIESCYKQNITDEFFPAINIDNYKGFDCTSDGLIFANFRADRARQLFAAFADENFNNFAVQKIHNSCLALIDYDNSFQSNHIFEKQNLSQTLGEILADHNLKQARIAETEKFTHVTYFFSGFRKEKFADEQRFLINSPKVKTFDLQPAMSAYQITDCYIENWSNFDFLLINFANPDMVGHTGNFNACVEAIEHVDRCLQKILLHVQNDPNHFLIITADHGNAEEMDDIRFRTCHSLNPVPFLIFNQNTQFNLQKNGNLTHIAPTILDIFNIKRQQIMNQKSLIVSKIDRTLDKKLCFS